MRSPDPVSGAATLLCLEHGNPPVLKTGTAWMTLLEMQDCLPGGRERGPAEKKIMMLLWYLGNQNSFLSSDKFDVSQGTAHNVVIEMLDRTCAIAELYICWPNDKKRQKTVQAIDSEGPVE
ncbi:hypothetical protein WMY93_028372 [Mugilogobius chulae]|uniref:Transposase Helix-turn-helix domain-containing protein n=1 Tax=Mugilogobius chulae TaxID=88201 RepID=A0AAW0N0C8_9GOBI